MMVVVTDDDGTEVRRGRRSWPAQYKLDILNEIEEAKESGEITVAEICRREGLYSSLISEWRKQRDEGALEGLRDRKPGRPKKDRTTAELARLRARLADVVDTATDLDLVGLQLSFRSMVEAIADGDSDGDPGR
jgi:transposase-like protein